MIENHSFITNTCFLYWARAFWSIAADSLLVPCRRGLKVVLLQFLRTNESSSMDVPDKTDAKLHFLSPVSHQLPLLSRFMPLSPLFPLPPDFVIKYERRRRWQGDTDLRGWATGTEPVLQLQIYVRPILSQHFFVLLFWSGYVVAHNSFDLHLWRQSSIPRHT